MEGADPDFDRLFDAFRPDRGGNRITANEMLAFEPLVNGNACPAEQRSDRIPCAVWALGSLIGATVAHEIAHSLGLADPGGSAFHNSDDFEGALMDAGPLRSFTERAEIRGVGPGVFCQHNFAYLQSILPTELPDPLSTRPVCF